MVLKVIRILYLDSRGVRCAICGNVACGVASVVLSLLSVWATKEIVACACAGHKNALTGMSVMFCLFMLGRLLASKCGQRIEAWSVARLSNRMRSNLFQKVMGAGFGAGQELHSADVVSRLSADVGSITSTICSTIPAIIVSAISFAGAFVYIAVLAPAIAVAVAVVMPMAVLVGKIPASRTYRLTAEIRSVETDMYRQLQDGTAHRLLISTIGYARKAAEEFSKRQSVFFRHTMKRNDLGLVAGGAVSLGFMTGYAVMFLYCAYGIVDSAVSFATMTALLQLTAMVQRPVVELSHKISPLVRTGVSVERIMELEKHYGAKPQSAIRHGDEIVFNNVSFRYNDSARYILKDYYEKIPTGKVTAVYGETGIGKTTLFRLLLGICQPEQGEVISPFDDSDHRNIVYIPQGNSLISGTVKTNLLMGDPDVSDEAMQKALCLAGAEFVFSLPDGILTKCGENGHGFSEGQAQRIAVARGIVRYMFLKKKGAGPVLLLMDEPTSSLDPETEALMLGRIMTYLKGETVVIISHRGDIKKYADKVICFCC